MTAAAGCPSMESMRLNDKLRGWLEVQVEKHGGQAEFSKLTGVGQNTWSRILNRDLPQRSMSDEAVEALCNVAGITEMDLIVLRDGPSAVREPPHSKYRDKYERFLHWLRTHPDAWPFVLNAAMGKGYKEEP